MPRRRKGRKNTTPGVGPEQVATAVADAVSEVMEPIKKKLEEIEDRLDGQEGVKIDGATLDAAGVDDPEQLEELLDNAADLAADQLEEDGNALAAAVIDAGLDTGEVVDEMVKRRKARKAAGEELTPATEEEVAEAIVEVAEEIAEELAPEEIQQLVDDGYIEDDEAKEEAAKRRKTTGGRKSGATGRSARSKKSASGSASRQTKKANTPAFQRKYSGIYTGAKSSQEKPKLTREQKLVKLARSVKCLDIFPGGIGVPVRDPEAAAHAAVKMYGDQQLARELKSMSVSEPSSGGFFVPQDTMDEAIELLYNETVVFELGARKVPMPHGNISIPKVTSGARAHFQGEARNIKVSQGTVGQLHMSSKRLDGLVISTEELLMSTDYASDLLFGNDLLEQMKQGVEYGALLARGTKFEPLGVYHNKKVEKVNLLTINDAQLANAQGRPTSDLPMFLTGKVSKKNVRGTMFGWTFNSDVETYLKRMKSSDGKYIWKDEMDTGMLDGKPYRTTNLIDTANNGTSIMIYGLWSDLLVGEQMGLTTRTSYEATVQTDNGSVNLFQSVQTATRANMFIDTGLRHDESFIVATNVKVFG